MKTYLVVDRVDSKQFLMIASNKIEAIMKVIKMYSCHIDSIQQIKFN